MPASGSCPCRSFRKTTIEVDYTAGRYTTKEKVGTRYVFILVRTLANPEDPKDMEAAHALQDAIKTEQASMGSFETPNWDAASQDKLRAALDVLGSLGGLAAGKFGNKSEVDPVAHLVATAIGWGGNPEYAAVYSLVLPKANDGKTEHSITVKDVPVDGFWSISVYNAKGFFEKNSLDRYSINNLTAKPNPDGSFTVQFGGCEKGTANCIPITPGWNYTVRLYRPRKPILDKSWTLPDAAPVK